MLLLKIMLGVIWNYFFRFFNLLQAMAPPALIKSPSPPIGAWEGVLGKSTPCAMIVFVIDIMVISKVYNFVFISIPLFNICDFLGKVLVSGAEFHKVNTG